ncbi:MAG: MFS transporter [Conexivisphaera sp.]
MSSATSSSNSNSSGSSSGSRIPWAIVVALSLGMLVYGVAESYGPVAALIHSLPTNLAFLGYSLPFVAGGFGALFSGWLADSIGRKMSFVVTAALIVIGVILYLIYSSWASATTFWLLVASFVLVGMAAIGLESPILAMLAEAVPAKWRGNLLVVVQNFGNLGVAITFIPVLIGLSGLAGNVAIAMLFIAPLAALIIALMVAGESLPWSAAAGRSSMDVKSAWRSVDGEAEPVKPGGSSLWFRLLVLIVLGIAQDVGFVYITYGVSYSYFTEALAESVPIVGGLTMTIVGIIFGIFFVERIRRKALAVLSFGMQMVFWAILWAYVAATHSTAGMALMALMTIQFLPVELTWASRAVLEPELFATRVRGRLISVVRTVVWIVAGIITGALTSMTLPFNIAAAFVFAMFVLSVAVAAAWWAWGFETAGRSLSGHDVL